MKQRIKRAITTIAIVGLIAIICVYGWAIYYLYTWEFY